MNERLRNGLVNLGLVVASVVVFLVIAEGYFAVFNPQLQSPSPPQIQHRENEFVFYQYNEVLGWKNKPNAEGFLTMPDSKTYIRINSKGLRDREYEYKKPNEIKRIVVLGDSFTWGYGVEDKERYSEILEDDLEDCQVINMGVTGYGTDQELLTFKTEGVKYSPDLVIVAFQIGSDIVNNANVIQYTYPKPLFVLDKRGKLNLTNTPVPRKEDWIKRWEIENECTKNLTFLDSFKRFTAKHSHTYKFVADKIVSNPALLEVFKKIGIVHKETFARGGYTQYTWDLTNTLLKEIDTAAKENGAKTLIVIVPNKEQVYKHIDLKLNEMLIDFGKENNIPALDCLPEFREHAKNGEQLYFKNDSHWNANGHKLAAELIYDKLIEEELISLGGEH